MQLNELFQYGTPARLTAATLDKLGPKSRLFAPLDIPVQNNLPPFGCGIEVEVEGINLDNLHPAVNKFWGLSSDGSLRNNGVEFVSKYLPDIAVIPALSLLHEALTTSQPHHSFSERTSVHVHLDFRTLSIQNLCSFLLTYVTIERLLFLFAGNHRFDSVYCVPSCVGDASHVMQRLFSLKSPEILVHMIGDLMEVFGRHYAALNLDNLFIHGHNTSSPTGTVEFRHMEGTIDVKRLTTWITLLGRLRYFAMITPKETVISLLKDINTTSAYIEYLNQIFGAYHMALTNPYPMNVVFKSISENISIAKSWLTKPKIHPVKFLASPLAKQVQAASFIQNEEQPPGPADPVVQWEQLYGRPAPGQIIMHDNVIEGEEQ